MTDKLDDFFSPDRLRGNWVKKQTREIDSTITSLGYEALYTHTRKLVTQRFSEKHLVILEGLMDELKSQLDLKFVHADEQPGPDVEVIKTAIDQTLAQIEDLVEAFEMKRQS